MVPGAKTGEAPMSTNTRRNILAGLGTAGAAAILATATATKASAQAAKVLTGKTAIVTGARNNIGRGFAVKLGEMGANVLVHYHRAETIAEAQETAKMVTDAGGKAELFQADLTKVENVKAMYDAAAKAFGGIDMIVNCIGVIIKKPMAQFTDEEFERLDAVNNKALFYSLREAANRLNEGGRVINVGTSLLAGAAPGYAIYSGTKAPVEEYTRMLAKELGEKKITVNVIGPGPINTPFFHAAENEQSVKYATGLSAEKRLGEVADLVPLLGFLASPESQWVNGQTLWINGAYLTR
jgi:NAD(P)-dependent dehydrogenase (short-subunit alcohol dehydrogenase family)